MYTRIVWISFYLYTVRVAKPVKYFTKKKGYILRYVIRRHNVYDSPQTSPCVFSRCYNIIMFDKLMVILNFAVFMRSMTKLAWKVTHLRVVHELHVYRLDVKEMYVTLWKHILQINNADSGFIFNGCALVRRVHVRGQQQSRFKHFKSIILLHKLRNSPSISGDRRACEIDNSWMTNSSMYRYGHQLDDMARVRCD